MMPMEQGDKIDQLATMIKGEFDSLRKEMDERFESVDKKFENLEEKMTNEFMSVRRGIDFLADRIQNHEVRIEVLEEKTGISMPTQV